MGQQQQQRGLPVKHPSSARCSYKDTRSEEARGLRIQANSYWVEWKSSENTGRWWGRGPPTGAAGVYATLPLVMARLLAGSRADSSLKLEDAQ